MRKLLIATTVVAGLVFAAPAMAWDQQECDDWYAKHGTPHEDCQAPPKPPPVQPPVAPPVAPPAPPVAPPAPPVIPPAPPAAPEAPPVSVPPKYDVPQNAPRVQDKPRREGTQGEVEKRADYQSTDDAFQTRRVSTATENGTLPYTGLPAGIAALAGLGLAGAGVAMRRRVR